MPITFPVHIGDEGGNEDSSDIGPWLIGGAWYVVGKENAPTFNVYKSIDLGENWIEQDDSNPASPAGFGHAIMRDGTDIIVLHVTVGQEYVFKKFDTTTDTWGTDSAPGPSATPTGISGSEQTARFVKVASGDYWIFYTRGTGPTVEIHYATFTTGGSWIAGGILVTDVSCYVQTAMVDGADLMHLFFKQNATGTFSKGPLSHITLTTGGTAGTPQTVDPFDVEWQAGHSVLWGSSIVVPYFNSSGRAGVWVGSGTLATPTWTFTLVNTTPVGNSDAFDAGLPITDFAFVDCGAAVLVWQSTSGAGSGYSVNAVYASANLGSGWSVPTLIYDEAANPPPWIGFDPPYLYWLSANMIGGALQVIGSIGDPGLAYLGMSTGPQWPVCGGYINKVY